MRNIHKLRELMPIKDFMNIYQLGENGEYEDWDDDISVSEYTLIHRDMIATVYFHHLGLEEKEELILLWDKPHLWGTKLDELAHTPIQQLDLFENVEEDHDKETKH